MLPWVSWKRSTVREVPDGSVHGMIEQVSMVLEKLRDVTRKFYETLKKLIHIWLRIHVKKFNRRVWRGAKKHLDHPVLKVLS